MKKKKNEMKVRRNSKKGKEKRKKGRNRIWKDKYRWRMVKMGRKREKTKKI